MLAALLEEKPKVVSFHFGVPAPERVRALRDAGIILLASATNPNDAQAVADAGIHAVVAQCYEAGGHRGVFDTDAPDSSLGTIALTRLLVRQLDIPVIAAGGICRLAKRISLTQLRKVLGLQSLKDATGNIIQQAPLPVWANLRQRALDVATAKINKKTDLNITLESLERSRHRRVDALIFAIRTQAISNAAK